MLNKIPPLPVNFREEPINLNTKYTGQEIQDLFMQNPELIAEYLNALIDKLNSTKEGDSGADNIAVTPIGDSPSTVQGLLEWVKSQLDSAILGQFEGNSIGDYMLASDIKIGSLAGLNTTEKISVTHAINEIVSELGKVDELDTEVKTNIVSAVNEIVNILTAHLADYAIDKQGFVPAGAIIMWSGTTANIPTGWALCNGQNGTPDLRDRFVMGATADSDIGEIGGENQVTLTVEQMPSHAHTGGTNSAGTHVHPLQNVPSSRSGGTHWYPTNQSGTGEAPSMGSSGQHTHSVTLNSTGGGLPHENRPAYYKLAFIIKL